MQHVEVLDVRSRDEARRPEAVERIRRASVGFFTDGDQLRITGELGDSPASQCLRERFEEGLMVAGTSAGAAAIRGTMLISGAGDESNEISAPGMAPELGLIHGVVIDSPFAERGRYGRLLGAVAQNPTNLGLGIEAATAIVLQRDHFRVLGSAAVCVMDGARISYSSLSESHPKGILSIYDVSCTC